MSTSCERWRVRIVLLAPDRGQDVHAERRRLMKALLAVAEREPAIEDVSPESDADDATVTVDATVVAGSGPEAEVCIGSALLPLTVWAIVATSHEVMRVDG